MPIDTTRYEKAVRYEIVLDDGEDYTKWSDIGLSTAGTITNSTTHITGTKSISFNKVAGNASAFIMRQISTTGMDLNSFASEGQLFFSVYLSSLVNVVSVDVRLLTDTSNYVNMSVAVADLSVGWNHLKVRCNTATQAGTGLDWKAVKKLALGVVFSAAGNTLSGILFDSIRIQIPTASVEFEAYVDNVDVSGSFAIKNGTDPDEAIVNAANTARTTASNVLVTQTVGADGTVPPTGSANTNAPFYKLTDGVHDLDLLTASGIFTADTKAVPVMSLTTAGTVMGDTATSAAFTKLTDGTDDLDILSSTSTSAAKIIPTKLYDDAGNSITTFGGGLTPVVGGVVVSGSQTADTATNTSTLIVPVKIVDTFGNSMPAGNNSTAPVYTMDIGGGGGGGGGSMLYMSPIDFTAAYSTVSGVALTGMSYTPVIEQFVSLAVTRADGSYSSYSRTTNVFTYNSTSSVVSIGGASFASNDLGYLVMVYGPDKAYDNSSDELFVSETDPISNKAIWEELVDTTNVAAGSNYYPSSDGLSMDGYSDLSAEFIFSGGVSMTVEGTLDDATTPDWIDITKAGYELSSNSYNNASFTDTQGIIDFENCCVPKLRFKVFCSDATNAVQIHIRRKAV